MYPFHFYLKLTSLANFSGYKGPTMKQRWVKVFCLLGGHIVSQSDVGSIFGPKLRLPKLKLILNNWVHLLTLVTSKYYHRLAHIPQHLNVG